jgi:peptidoglycan/xylan/chitin deacetylase (PgdA/CDA1 family)
LGAMLKRVLHKVQRSWRKSFYLAYMDGMLYSRKKSGDLIVMYHNVDDLGEQRYNRRFISKQDFRRQLLYLKREFEIVSLAELCLKTNPGIQRLAITFDDGLKNNFTHAAPVLRRLGIPATFFICTPAEGQEAKLWPDELNILTSHLEHDINLGGSTFHRHAWNVWKTKEGLSIEDFFRPKTSAERRVFLDELTALHPADFWQGIDPLYYQLMSEDEMTTLSRHPLFDLGCHAQDHSLLGLMDKNEAVSQLANNKNKLERLTGTPIGSVAYPDGNYSRELIDDAENLGLDLQMAVNFRFPEDEMDGRLWSRFGFHQDRSWIEQLHRLNLRFHEKQ